MPEMEDRKLVLPADRGVAVRVGTFHNIAWPQLREYIQDYLLPPTPPATLPSSSSYTAQCTTHTPPSPQSRSSADRRTFDAYLPSSPRLAPSTTTGAVARPHACAHLAAILIASQTPPLSPVNRLCPRPMAHRTRASTGCTGWPACAPKTPNNI